MAVYPFCSYMKSERKDMSSILTAKIPRIVLVSLFIHGLGCLVSSIIHITTLPLQSLLGLLRNQNGASWCAQSMADLDIAAVELCSAAPNLVFHTHRPPHLSSVWFECIGIPQTSKQNTLPLFQTRISSLIPILVAEVLKPGIRTW